MFGMSRAEKVPFKGIFKYYFGLDCIKRFARDQLEREGDKITKTTNMIFTTEAELYHKANNICHICSEICINKVKEHSHETGKNRGPACNLSYKQENFIPVIIRNGFG